MKLSRKKLGQVWQTYMTQKHSSEFAVVLPVQFQRGRYGYGIMSDPQVEDLRTHCLRMETLGFAMTISQLNECLTRFKLFNCGIFRTFEEFSLPTIEHCEIVLDEQHLHNFSSESQEIASTHGQRRKHTKTKGWLAWNVTS